MFDENDDVSMHAMRKPKTMDNNCVNLKCLNNRQKLVELKDKYKKVENIQQDYYLAQNKMLSIFKQLD